MRGALTYGIAQLVIPIDADQPATRESPREGIRDRDDPDTVSPARSPRGTRSGR